VVKWEKRTVYVPAQLGASLNVYLAEF
jgi:hypothetical protein